jgi:predicted hydrolase (HD superfamily)
MGLPPRQQAPPAATDRAPLTRAEAWDHLCAWTPTAALRNHARAVEIVMRAAAQRYGAGEPDVERFGLAGMLHDADYDRWPEEHPRRITAWLHERGEPELAHAVSAHYTRWGVPHESILDKALVACDELTGFVGACALVRPEGIATLTPKSVRKKLKQKSFAAGVDRDEVEAGARLLVVDLDEHVAFVIAALQPFADELGLTAGAS